VRSYPGSFLVLAEVLDAKAAGDLRVDDDGDDSNIIDYIWHLPNGSPAAPSDYAYAARTLRACWESRSSARSRWVCFVAKQGNTVTDGALRIDVDACPRSFLISVLGPLVAPSLDLGAPLSVDLFPPMPRTLRGERLCKRFVTTKRHFEGRPVLCRYLDRSLARVAKLTLAQAQDRRFLEGLIRTTGLHDFNYGIYVGARDLAHVFPIAAKGQAGLYQIPAQLACALHALLPFNIRTFLEVGTNTGWTAAFIHTYLARVAALRGETFRRSVTMDVNPVWNSCARNVAGLDALIWNVTSAAVARDRLGLGEGEKIDLCLIDGDHSHGGVWHDTAALVSVCRYLMYHDINDGNTPGVVAVWEDLKQMHPASVEAECLQQTHKAPGENVSVLSTFGSNRLVHVRHMGIGILRSATDLSLRPAPEATAI
jgi:hypothetical protein